VAGPPEGPLALSLAEALELALLQSHAVRRAKLDVAVTDSQVDQAWGSVYPRVDASLRYTRTLETPNPFAGSSAGSIFGGLGQVGWLDYNERARTDADAATEPLTLEEYLRRNGEGLDAAGIEVDPDANPFLVENEFIASISVSQVLYNGAAFAALDGAEAVRAQVTAGIEVEAQRTVERASRAYLGSLLADAQVAVLDASVARVEETLEDTRRLVAQGVVAKYQQLTAEVELANLETARIQASDAAASAREALKLALGLPVSRELRLTDALGLATAFTIPQVDGGEASRAARENRPDLKQLRLARRTSDLQTEVARAAFRPVVAAFLNLSYLGRVPDNRETTVADPMVPFAYSKAESDFFDDAYWNANITAGLSLTWNLFAGFEDQARVAQTEIGRRRLEDQLVEVERVVEAEVVQAVRALETAAARIRTQEKNLARADLNYQHARARVKEGVSTQLELRSASQQLDETRFNHLQAVHDYLVAWTRYEVAVGIRPGTNLPIVPTGADEPLPVPPTGVPPVPPPPAPDASAPISIVPGETP
jgi:outer membrane protein TolC